MLRQQANMFLPSDQEKLRNFLRGDFAICEK